LLAGCPWCNVRGFKLAGAARYFTAIILLPKNDPLRTQFAAEFDEKKEVKALAQKFTLTHRTQKLKIKSGETASKDPLGKFKDEPFFAVDAFSEFFEGQDILWRCIYDLAHGLSNNTCDLFSLVLNTDSSNQMFFSAKRREFEQVTLNRYEEYGKRERMPWMADREVYIYVCVSAASCFVLFFS
jgi:hypothetical protein